MTSLTTFFLGYMAFSLAFGVMYSWLGWRYTERQEREANL